MSGETTTNSETACFSALFLNFATALFRILNNVGRSAEQMTLTSRHFKALRSDLDPRLTWELSFVLAFRCEPNRPSFRKG